MSENIIKYIDNEKGGKVSDYVYIGETLLFGVSFVGDEENKRSFLVKYSIKDKTHEVFKVCLCR